MKTIVKIGSFFTTTMMIIVTFASVVGYQSGQTTGKDLPSPLFHIRTQRAIHTTNERSMIVDYLGKGKYLPHFTSSKSMFNNQLNKAFQMMNNNPALIQKFFEKISKDPQIIRLFQQHGLRVDVVRQSLALIKDSPELLSNQLNKFHYSDDFANDSRPLGLDTSSAIGCFITALVLLPIAILIGVLIATLTIVTCLNIGGCFTTVVQAILTGMLQGIHQPYE